jgi:hypothetical protein
MGSLLTFQGYVGVGFIGVSLLLWLTQTVMPFWRQTREFQAAGVKLQFSFTVLELQNWAPLGHQNYVAGYLILILPLLFLLAWVNQGKARWFWGIALGLGLGDVYTTGSRGSLLGLVTLLLLALIGIGINRQLPRHWWFALTRTAITLVGILTTVHLWNWGLTSALLAYGVVSLTDYQLDNVAISGIIVIYLACLLQLWQPSTVENPQNPFARPSPFCFLPWTRRCNRYGKPSGRS